MQATSQNQLAAYYMGIPVKLIFSLVWAISAGVATAAGILLAPVTLIDINMGLAVALKAFAAAVLGGFGSIPGALVGGIIIGLIELYAGATLPEGFKDTAPYIVLLIMLACGRRACLERSDARRFRGANAFPFKTAYEQDIRLFRDGSTPSGTACSPSCAAAAGPAVGATTSAKSPGSSSTASAASR